MARPALAQAALPTPAQLRTFARLAAPRLLLDAPRPGESRAAGRQAGPGLVFREHRDYAPGDDLRHLSWPASRRLGRYTVRRFDAPRRADWVVCVDASSSMATGDAGKLAFARVLALALCYALLDAGHRVALVAYAERALGALVPGRGQAQYQRIHALLEGLCATERGAATHLLACAPLLAGAHGAVILSDFLGEGPAGSALARLARADLGLRALAIADPADRAPGDGRLYDLEDAETGQRLGFSASPAAAARVEAALATRARTLARQCAACAIPLTRAEVGERWQRVLLRHLDHGRDR